MRLKNRIVQAILSLLFFILVVSAIFIDLTASGDLSVFFVLLFCLLGLVVGGYLGTILHELGHMFFGICVGMSLQNFQIAFLHWQRKNGKIKMRIEPSLVAGACAMIPKSSKHMRKKFFFLSVGGLFFSGVLTLISGFFFFYRFNLPLHFILGMGFPVHAYSFFLNLFPMETPTGKTDGAVAIGILKKNPSEVVAIHVLTIQGMLNLGSSPEAIPKDLFFSVPQLPEDDRNYIALLSLQYLFYLGIEEKGDAHVTLERLASLTDYLSDEECLEIESNLLYDACEIGDTKTARKLYSEICSVLEEGGDSNCRILCRYFSFVGEMEEYQFWRERFFYWIQQEPILGIEKQERRLMQKIEDLEKIQQEET